MNIAVVGYATYKRSNCEVVVSMRGTLKIASITHSTSPSYSYWPRAVSIIKGPVVCFIKYRIFPIMKNAVDVCQIYVKI